MIDLDLCIGRRSSAAAEVTGQELMILDLDSGRYFGSGLVGLYVWDRLDGTATLRSIAEQVAGHFSIEPTRANNDVLAFVQSLVDENLAEVWPV